MKEKINDSTVYIFKTICEFVKDLDDVFGKSYTNLHLYAALLEKTGIVHEEPVKKHITSFHDYVQLNDEAILKKDKSLLKDAYIQYSDRVFIPLKQIIMIADDDEERTIWQHLITLLALLDPSSQAKEILKEEQERKKKQGESGHEEKFLTDIIDKVGRHVDPTSTNPGDMMKGIMQSGVFNELVESMNNGISDGDLDLGKLMSSLQNMMGNIGQMVDNVKTSRSI